MKLQSANRQTAFASEPTSAQPQHARAHRAYTVAQLCEVLELPRSTFFHLRQSGQLPFVQELRPRIGRLARFRAEPVDRWLAGEWQQPRAFRSHAAIVQKSTPPQLRRNSDSNESNK